MKIVYRRWSNGSIGVAFNYDDVPRGADVLRVEHLREPARELRELSARFFDLAESNPRRSTDRNGDGA